MESYADFKIVVGANRIVRQASPALNTQCPMTCSRTTGRRGARSDRPEQQEADISDAKNEISDLGTESQDTKQELKLQNCAERGTAGLDVEKLYHHHHLYHQRLPTAATSATCVASLHYPLGSQKQDEGAGRSKSQFLAKTVYRGPREDPHRREVTQAAS